MATDTGGPAFPHIAEKRRIFIDGREVSGIQADIPGATLLDYFAGVILSGMFASESQGEEGGMMPGARPHEDCLTIAARQAYDYATAMIAEKRRRETDSPE